MNQHSSDVASRALESKRFRSLLVPIDLTAISDRVLGRLRWIPLADDARVTVLHVVPRGLTVHEERKAERDAIRLLADEVRHSRKLLPAGVSIEPVLEVGTTAKAITSATSRVKAELVVMGRGSSRLLRDDFIGSTAERVVRQARVPVLVVRLAPRSSYARPALAIALDKAACRAVGVMLRVLPAPWSEVSVIHAFDSPYRSFLYPSLSEDGVDERVEELQLKATRSVRSLLRKALAEANVLPPNAPQWKEHVRLGSPRSVVDSTVKRIRADLLVLGTHGHSGTPYLFLGTVAGDLLRQSRCDVLVVPPARD
jgi:nucleotide-binding universal stress UspA family protein